jgi:hypothetical protein
MYFKFATDFATIKGKRKYKTNRDEMHSDIQLRLEMTFKENLENLNKF